MRIYILLIIGFALFACKENVFTPKPRTYPRVVYPEKKYKLFSQGYCPIQCEIPEYATIERDSTFLMVSLEAIVGLIFIFLILKEFCIVAMLKLLIKIL